MLQELDLAVSVGIASNKMVAKLASLASKPDGILVIDDDDALQKLLQSTPASRLPRCGGKVTDTLMLAGIHTIADLQVRVQLLLTCVRVVMPHTSRGDSFGYLFQSSCKSLRHLPALCYFFFHLGSAYLGLSL